MRRIQPLVERLALAMHLVRAGVERMNRMNAASRVEVDLVALQTSDLGHAVLCEVAKHVVE